MAREAAMLRFYFNILNKQKVVDTESQHCDEEAAAVAAAQRFMTAWNVRGTQIQVMDAKGKEVTCVQRLHVEDGGG
jgi:hypothetical protein